MVASIKAVRYIDESYRHVPTLTVVVNLDVFILLLQALLIVLLTVTLHLIHLAV